MLPEIIKSVFRFFLLILFQVIVLNKIRFAGYINPYVYPLFIMLLPVRIPKTLLLMLAFITGITVDIFSDTLGMHAAATVFLAFLRPTIIKILAPRDGYEAEAIPSFKLMGIQWMLYYLFIAVFLHHIFLFYAEVFRFSDFGATLLRTILSTVVSVVLMVITLLLFDKTKMER
jgi:rod shape-determining protein MreD